MYELSMLISYLLTQIYSSCSSWAPLGLFIGAIPGLSVTMLQHSLFPLHIPECSDAMATIMGLYVVGVFSEHYLQYSLIFQVHSSVVTALMVIP